LQPKTGPCYVRVMAAPPSPCPIDREPGSVVVFAIDPDSGQAAVREMAELCRRHGAEPLVLDAAQEPWFADHLKDPRTREHFPLLCVRGGLVGGIVVVRQLEAHRKLGPLLSSLTTQEPPRIALSRDAADELRSALVERDLSIRIVVTAAFEHDLAVDSPRPDDLRLMLGDIPILLDVQSATRADGLAIDWIDTGEGKAFRIDNPNRPAAVREVDRRWLEGEGRGLPLLVIDVRTAAEYSMAHLDGARLLDATLIDALDQLDRRTPLLFYCNAGIRSRKAAERYRELGFSEVYCLSESHLQA
jgi:monothiol glutaredoxin